MQLRVVLLCAFLITLCGLCVAQNPKVINIPVRHTSANSGKEMFAVAAALKVPPTDLTILARQKAGKFPSMQVAKAITGEAGISAHGSKDMPIWGPVFMSMSHQHESVVHLRVANLTEYIKSLQQK